MNERLAEHFHRLPELLGGHLLLALPAILAGVLVSVPLGVLASRCEKLRGPVLTVASLAQTIPSIALLAIMVAVLGGTIGYRPAFIALFIYSMLPILRNTVTGLDGIDPALREAARGVGMTPRQSLWQVELPLALPVILAGIRTATVWVVGITTLSTPVGAPSLGNYIFSGLQLRDWNQVYFGCLFAMALTLVLDQAVRLFELAASRRKAAPAWAASAILAVVLVGGFIPRMLSGGGNEIPVSASPAVTSSPEPGALLAGREFRIGAKGFTEQAILARRLAIALESEGASTDILGNMGSTILFDALRNDSIDVYVDYSGTMWATVMKREEQVGRTAMAIEVANHLLREHGIHVLGRLGFENTYCFAVRSSTAERLGLRAIDDLRPHLGDMTLGGDPEFFGRPEWTRARELYGLDRLSTRGMDPTFMYQAARDRQVDAIAGFSTDGRIAAFDLEVLSDPRQAFPPYDAMILLSPSASRDPMVARSLRPLVNQIDVATMRKANKMVDVDGSSPKQAAEWLAEDSK